MMTLADTDKERGRIKVAIARPDDLREMLIIRLLTKEERLRALIKAAREKAAKMEDYDPS